MAIDEEKIEQQLLEIRFRNSISEEDMIESVKPLLENPAFKNFFESEGIKEPIDLFVGPAELEMMEESDNAWSEFISALFVSLRLFTAREEVKFYESVPGLSKALDGLWMTFMEAPGIQMTLKEIFRDCAPEYYALHENKIWMTIYLNLTHPESREAILNDLSGAEVKAGKVEPPDQKMLVKKLLDDYKVKGDLVFDEIRKIRKRLGPDIPPEE